MTIVELNRPKPEDFYSSIVARTRWRVCSMNFSYRWHRCISTSCQLKCPVIPFLPVSSTQSLLNINICFFLNFLFWGVRYNQFLTSIAIVIWIVNDFVNTNFTVSICSYNNFYMMNCRIIRNTIGSGILCRNTRWKNFMDCILIYPCILVNNYTEIYSIIHYKIFFVCNLCNSFSAIHFNRAIWHWCTINSCQYKAEWSTCSPVIKLFCSTNMPMCNIMSGLTIEMPLCSRFNCTTS